MITQEQKDQIRKMAEEYAKGKSTASVFISAHISDYQNGAEAVLERLDIDDDKLTNILLDVVKNNNKSYTEAKQQILNAIRIGG